MRGDPGSGANTFYCATCSLRFALHTGRRFRRTFCPSCGETEGVAKYDHDKHKPQPKQKQKRWTTDELAEIKRLLLKGLTPTTICGRYGVTRHAIEGTIERHKLRQKVKK